MATVAQPERAWPTEELQVKKPIAVDGATRPGFSWVLAEPVPGYPPGTKVSLPDSCIQMTGDRSALVAIGSLVVRACEVSDKELQNGAWAHERCKWLSHEIQEWQSAAKRDMLFSPAPRGPSSTVVECETTHTKTEQPRKAQHAKFAEDVFGGDSASEEEDPPAPRRRAATHCAGGGEGMLAAGRATPDRISPVLTAELKDYQSRVDFLHTIVSPSTDLTKYLDTLVQQVMTVVQADRCSLFFVDEVRQEIWCIRALDIDPIRLPWGKGIVGQVAIEGELIQTADAHSHPSFDPTVEKQTGYATKSLICLPIKHTLDGHRTIGVIQALNKVGDGGFSQEDTMELFKLSMLVCDSFNRHRWRALERGASYGDSGASSLIAHQEGHWSSRTDLAKGSLSSGSITFSRKFSGVMSPRSAERLRTELAKDSWPQAALCTLEFNALEYSGDELARFVPKMMDSSGCVEGCGIPENSLHAWAKAAQGKYHDNTFHNWAHGFSCFQNCYYQIFASDIYSKLRCLDVLGLLAAALCHDLDHPGFTNSYLIQAQTELALRYNDVSVLESHHASLACELLRGESTRITAGLDEASQRAIRKTMIRCILDTDMVHHGGICKQIVAMTGSTQDSITSVEESRQNLLSACIHTADLSGQTMRWPVAKQWEDRVAREFVKQAAAESAAGYTPAPFMQFGIDDVKKRGKLQRDFVDFVLVPLWMPYTELIPELRTCYDNLVRNRSLWNHRLEHGRDSEDADKPELRSAEVSS